jgi:hypothetical protein
MTTLDDALRQFEATEANLEKLEKLWKQISDQMPSDPAFGHPPEYDELCLAFRRVLAALPAIDGFRVEDRLYEYGEIGQMRFDALELGEIESQVSVENEIGEQGRLLREYRFRLLAKRRELVRDRMLALIDEVDSTLRESSPPASGAAQDPAPEALLSRLRKAVAELDTLLGSSARPARWGDLQRHLHFGTVTDLRDIYRVDWPAAKEGLRADLYGQHDPVPIAVTDLGEVVANRPKGPVTTKLDWSVLTDEDFERLLFLLISDTPGYENPEWLQQTHAPDRGRDLSVTKVEHDPLSGVRRYRIIIQCKRWLSNSVGPADVSAARSQMELWQPPRVDGLVIATTGRFTADAVALVEQHNQADHALHIDMWPDSRLERLLAARPHLIGQFRLRRGD